MVILVTGGCGYIGSQLIRDLAKEFRVETIRILDNMLREKYVSLWNLPDGNYEFIEGDITKKEDVEKAFKDVNVVYDLAGITNAPLSFDRKELTFNVNQGGVKIMVEEALNNGVDKYIYLSSASVYGPTKDVVTEEHECKPVSPYGESKLLAEKELLRAKNENNLNVTILRSGTVYGWSIGMRFDTVVDRFVYLACLGMPLTVWDSAVREKRPYVHIRDCVDGLIFAHKNFDRMNGEIYNLVGQNAGIGEVVDTIKKFIPNVKVTITKTPTLNQLSYVTDGSKIERLGFRPRRTMEEGIREIVEKFRAFLK